MQRCPQPLPEVNAALPPDVCAFDDSIIVFGKPVPPGKTPRLFCLKAACGVDCGGIRHNIASFLELIYNGSLGALTFVDGTMARFAGAASGIGSTSHFQPQWPFLSYVQAAPPRFQISQRQ
jgi:hypothetical protein